MQMIKKCLFPAAGYGTRFLPATKAVPKEMLPVLTKPLLQYGVEEALKAGINEMAIVTGRGKRAIEDHFDDSFELESQLTGTSKEHYLDEIQDVIDRATFTYVRQRKALGLGHAILTGKSLIGNEPFSVILADDLCDSEPYGVLSKMIEIYNEFKCSIIAIKEVPVSEIHNYGIVFGDPIDGYDDAYKINNLIEKPDLSELQELGLQSPKAKSFDGIVGRYILTPRIFDYLIKTKPNLNNEIQLTDAILALSQSEKVIAYRFKGERFDCGNVEGFVNATNYFARKGI
jgi:UTP--glucose-1-phosphate uridylyltransferase